MASSARLSVARRGDYDNKTIRASAALLAARAESKVLI